MGNLGGKIRKMENGVGVRKSGGKIPKLEKHGGWV